MAWFPSRNPHKLKKWEDAAIAWLSHVCVSELFTERGWIMLIQMGTPQETIEEWPELWQKWGRAAQTPLLSFLPSSGESRSGQNLQNRTSYFFLDVENTPEELSRIKKVGLLIEQPFPSAASTQDQNEKWLHLCPWSFVPWDASPKPSWGQEATTGILYLLMFK